MARTAAAHQAVLLRRENLTLVLNPVWFHLPETISRILPECNRSHPRQCEREKKNHRGCNCDSTKCLRSFWHASIRIGILSVYMINFVTSWLHNNHKLSEPWTRPLIRPRWIQTVSDTMCWKAHLFIYTDCISAQKEFLKDLCWVLFSFHRTWRLWRSGVHYYCVISEYPNSQGDERLVSCF